MQFVLGSLAKKSRISDRFKSNTEPFETIAENPICSVSAQSIMLLQRLLERETKANLPERMVLSVILALRFLEGLIKAVALGPMSLTSAFLATFSSDFIDGVVSKVNVFGYCVITSTCLIPIDAQSRMLFSRVLKGLTIIAKSIARSLVISSVLLVRFFTDL